MEVINSKPFTLKQDINTIFGMVSKPSILSGLLEKVGDKVPLKGLSLTDEGFGFDAPIIGQIKFVRAAESTKNLVRYKAESAAVPLSLLVHMKEASEGTDMQLSLEADLPSFLKGMLSSKLSPALEKVSDLLGKVDFDKIKF